MKCRRHVLRGGASDDQRQALVRTLAAAIRAGQLCVLPTETVYGLAVRPGDDATVAAVRALKGRPESHPFTWHLAAPDDAARLGRFDDARCRRLAARYWPGPLTLVVPARPGGATVRHGLTTVGLRVPAHDLTRDVIAAVGQPLWMTSINRSGAPPLCDPDAIAAEFGDRLDHLVDAGESPLGNSSTVVRVTDAGVEVLREGILSAAEVHATATPTVLFVCTGNTCRSPLAEAIARREAASHGLVGLEFASAGVGAVDGAPASAGSLEAAREVGLDLGGHHSRQLTTELVRGAARVYALSESHRRALLHGAPELEDRVALLSPDGADIDDPFGADLAVYRQARDAIAAAVAARLDEWRTLIASTN